MFYSRSNYVGFNLRKNGNQQIDQKYVQKDQIDRIDSKNEMRRKRIGTIVWIVNVCS